MVFAAQVCLIPNLRKTHQVANRFWTVKPKRILAPATSTGLYWNWILSRRSELYLAEFLAGHMFDDTYL